MSGINTMHNEYSKALGKLFDEMPKAVLAAVAVSYASAGGDALDIAERVIAYEWRVLFENGIVAQRPTRHAYKLADQREKEVNTTQYPETRKGA